MKKYWLVTFLALASVVTKADNSCSKYDAFTKAIETGDKRAESLYYDQCENQDCSNAKTCLANIYSTISSPLIESPRSAEVLENLGFPIAQKDSNNTDALDRAVSTCNAESLFFLRLYGIGRALNPTRVGQAVTSLRNESQAAQNFCLLPFCLDHRPNFKNKLEGMAPDKREETREKMAKKERENQALQKKCEQSLWVMSLSETQIRNMAHKNQLKQTHQELVDEHFENHSSLFNHTSIDIFYLMQMALAYNITDDVIAEKISDDLSVPEKSLALKSMLELTPGTEAELSQVDRMLLGLLQLKKDHAGIFNTSH